MTIYCLCWCGDAGVPMQSRYFQTMAAAQTALKAIQAAYATLGIKNSSATITTIKVE